MLRQLLSRLVSGPRAIDFEEDSLIADEEREKFLLRVKGFTVAPTFAEQIKFKDVEQYFVSHHNKTDSR